jgi:hypothetical protein
MAMKRIEYKVGDGTYLWFHDTYGYPQIWVGTIVQPKGIRSRYKWAVGQHRKKPSIWCEEDVFVWYQLKQA